MPPARWTRTVATALLLVSVPALAADPTQKPAGAVRFATFNASLNRGNQGGLVADLSNPDDPQARNVAEIIQRVRPDVLLLNEFDYEAGGEAAALFQKNYLSVAQNEARPIEYPHRYTAEVNTGVASGRDLDGDGRADHEPGTRGYGNDAVGFGLFPGQYGMVVYSMYPIDREGVVSLQGLLWKAMPGARLPARPDGSPWYSPGALEVLRLSSKGHWVVPISIEGKTVHVLASHPTPPAFDGPEDRNGKRNADEIRLWADLLTGGPSADYLRDLLPGGNPLLRGATFVLMGDLNADPVDGDSIPGGIQQLLDHPRVNPSFVPASEGAVAASTSQGGRNATHKGDPAADTADFSDGQVGNLRVDYVLPSRDLRVIGGGVFWPAPGDPLSRLVGGRPEASSDHRLVYLDVAAPG